ncbi:MAG TPA: DUF1249 domain-containing protein [Solimonas sp.]|nr:DUF1249 domain-containing protein [Solimonas sp.]
MQASTHLCPCCGKPRRIAHLMELYERNYRMLLRLLPDLDGLDARMVSSSASDCPLHVRLLERDRYTLSLHLTYEFTDDQGLRRQPDLWVRLYRDAGVAEALECSHRPPWDAEDEADPAAHAFLSAQWKRNLLLEKWLEYLLQQGHGFSPQTRAEPLALA